MPPNPIMTVIGDVWVSVHDLATQVEQTSCNSSKPPPSSDGPYRAATLGARVSHGGGGTAGPSYQRRMQTIRRRFQQALVQGSRLPWTRYAGRCQYLLDWEPRLWTFLSDPAIPLTNNDAERRLRGYVLWRKGSFGVWSHRGELFRQRILPLVETCKLGGESAMEVLYEIVDAVIRRQPYPDRLVLNAPDTG